MADEMKAPSGMTGRRNDVERIADQPVDAVVVELSGVGPGIDRIAALVRGYCEIACARQCRQLIVPEMARYAEPVQHKHQRRIICAGDRNIKDQTWCRFDSPR